MTTGPREWVPPRFGTPRNLERQSLGYQVGEVSSRLGKLPMPYQQHVWDVALEVEADGRFAYDAVDLTIMRQSGKTTLEFAKSTWRLTVAPKLPKPDGKPWGRQRALYTAQRRQDARKKLEQEFAVLLRESPSFREIRNVKARPTKPTEWKISLNNGAEHILFGTGNYFQIDAPVKDAGHSDTLDDANLDEIWALQNDDIEHGMGPTMATRWNPQMWRFSTAGDENSFYLYGMVRSGRAKSCTCGAQFMDGCTCGFTSSSKDRTAYFEWSIPDDVNIDDEALWWEYMPALGRTISPEFVRSQLEKARRKPEEGGEDLWRRGYGNQWVKIPLLGGEARLAKLPATQWAEAIIALDDVPAMNPGEVAFGFDVSPAGEWSSIAVAAGTQNAPYVELTGTNELQDHRPATGWLPARLVELVHRWKPLGVGFDQSGPAGALADTIRAAFADASPRIDPDVLKPLTSTEYKAACGAFYLDVKESRLARADQSPLTTAGIDATARVVMDAWVWDRRPPAGPISPLVAATVARSLLPTGEKNKPVFWA